MSQQFLNQAKELWQTVSAPETANSYKSTLALTWKILQQLGKTLWLGLCSLLVAVDWIGTAGLNAGQSLRTQTASLQKSLESAKTEDIASQTGQRMLASSKSGVTNAIANARKQLGLDEKPTMFARLAEMKEEQVAEAAQTEATTAKAVKTEPVKTEPAKTEPAKTEVVEVEPAAVQAAAQPVAEPAAAKAKATEVAASKAAEATSEAAKPAEPEPSKSA